MVFGLDALVYPTKLLLMPALTLAALVALGIRARSRVGALLLLAIAFSWLGDGAGIFFPFLDDELPAMLACFGLAHLAYIALFLRALARRPLPRWALVYVAWWVTMIALLWPHLGALAIGVAIYGVVLGGTAASAARGSRITAAGGAFFLASDTLLALLLFLPGVSDALTGPWVMLTYTIGQGLLVFGAVRLLTRGER
ncbi:MAG: lysoplasmalogenase [Microbacterium sp.]|nr:lysoplasmalogenase [Microbacterium sp.]